MRQLFDVETTLDRRRFGGQHLSDRIPMGLYACSAVEWRFRRSDVVNAVRQEVAADRNDLYARPRTRL